jgi:hypothetical protein
MEYEVIVSYYVVAGSPRCLQTLNAGAVFDSRPSVVGYFILAAGSGSGKQRGIPVPYAGAYV